MPMKTTVAASSRRASRRRPTERPNERTNDRSSDEDEDDRARVVPARRRLARLSRRGSNRVGFASLESYLYTCIIVVMKPLKSLCVYTPVARATTPRWGDDDDDGRARARTRTTATTGTMMTTTATTTRAARGAEAVGRRAMRTRAMRTRRATAGAMAATTRAAAGAGSTRAVFAMKTRASGCARRTRASETSARDVVVGAGKADDAGTTRARVGGGAGKALRVCAFAACAMAVTAMVMPEGALAAKASAAASATGGESVLAKALSWVMHLDKHLAELFVSQGKMAYGILFAIVFAETGFVVTPFLPGDSLLFATGALGALGVVNFPLTCALLFAAAVLGDTVNYSIGSFVGSNFMETHPKVFPPEYIDKTRRFYDQYGGKTVVLARFFVIVRTFAPFIAGVAHMNYSKFIFYNLLGGALWIASFMGLGYFFGAIPAVQENFALAVAGIVVLSLLPVIAEIVQHAKGDKGEETPQVAS